MIKLLRKYLEDKGYKKFDLKAVMFDMDGVLYDSMSDHDKAWQQAIEEFNLKHEPFEFYLQEGRTGKSTINAIFQRNLQRNSTEEEEKNVYARKLELFLQSDRGATMPDAKETLSYVKEKGLKPILVSGSGQPSLPEKLNTHFPGVFTPETMVTSFDVVHGKPDPEPFLMGLEKGGNLTPNQAIAIENAPLGVEAAVGAGIFTIAVNTGPLEDKTLIDAGAAIVFDSMTELLKNLPDFFQSAENIHL